MQRRRLAALGAALAAFLSGAAARDDQPEWVKYEAARAAASVTGNPLLVFVVSDLIPGGTGPSTDSLDRAWAAPNVRKQWESFHFVKCSDPKTSEAVRAVSRGEVIITDPDGDEIARDIVRSAEQIEKVMKTALERYADKSVPWVPYGEKEIESRKKSGLLLVIAFVAEGKDRTRENDDSLKPLEDRSIVKLHPRCAFLRADFRKDSPLARRWGVAQAPTLVLADLSKEPGPEAVLDRAVGKKTPRELKALLQKGLKALAKRG